MLRDKADVHRCLVPPGLADNPFHAPVNLLDGGAAVVDGELDEEQVGMVFEHIVAKAEHTQIGPCASNGGIDFAEGGLRVLLLKPGERLRAPAGLRGDAASQISDADLGTALEFGIKVRQAPAFLTLEEFVLPLGVHLWATIQAGEGAEHSENNQGTTTSLHGFLFVELRDR